MIALLTVLLLPEGMIARESTPSLPRWLHVHRRFEYPPYLHCEVDLAEGRRNSLRDPNRLFSFDPQGAGNVSQADYLSAAYSVNKRKLDQLYIVLPLAQVIDIIKLLKISWIGVAA
jgi:hypothetical protein